MISAIFRTEGVLGSLGTTVEGLGNVQAFLAVLNFGFISGIIGSRKFRNHKDSGTGHDRQSKLKTSSSFSGKPNRHASLESYMD